MDYAAADKVMRNIHLRNDWSLQWFHATVHTESSFTESEAGLHAVQRGRDGGQDTLLCQIRGLVADSSSYPLYGKKSIANAHFVVRLAEVNTPEELLRIVMDNLCLMAIHEEREFMRFGPTWLAPFHPHRPDGQHLWVVTSPKSILPEAAVHPVITVE